MSFVATHFCDPPLPLQSTNNTTFLYTTSFSQPRTALHALQNHITRIPKPLEVFHNLLQSSSQLAKRELVTA
jgi:hypothetical protein